MSDTDPSPNKPSAARWAKPAVTVLFFVAFWLLYLLVEPFRDETNRAIGVLASGDVEAARDYILSYGAWAPVISASLMVGQALAAPLPAFLITFANGLAFGAFWGGILSLASATLAAAISFGISHALGRTVVEALVGRESLGGADRWFERFGVYAVFIARLIPIVSFDVISYAAGLTRMGFWKFLLATVVGMAPATFVYSHLGERAPQYINIMLVAFGVVVATLVVFTVVRRRGRRN
ncbi:MAG: TVP38/TMEM64 family protein [Rubrobacteraceae bacterium]